jgi:hypothetical protein
LIALLKDAFDRYKEDTLGLTTVVVEIAADEGDKKEVEELRTGIVECTVPSQLVTLRGYGDALISKAIATLERVYTKIFEIEGEIVKENPPTEVYPVEYWARDKMGEVEELKSLSAKDIKGFLQRYRLLASDAHSRLLYDAERVRDIKGTTYSF